MLQRTIQLIGITSLMLATWVAAVGAQEALSPQKRALIQELLSVTNAQGSANTMLTLLSKQLEANVLTLLKTSLSNNLGLEGEELQRRIGEASPRVLQRYRELLPQRVKFTQEVEQINYSVYAKYYTDAELRDLITFYKTPTGRKAVAIMPQIVQESLQRSLAWLVPQQMQLLQEVIQQEVRGVQSQLGR